jgi:hypothetical protein
MKTAAVLEVQDVKLPIGGRRHGLGPERED